MTPRVPNLHLLGAEPDPYPTLAELRSAAPIVWDATNEAWSVTRYAEARRVLGDPDTFSSQAVAEAIVGPTDGHESAGGDREPVSELVPIIGLDGEPHSRLRRIVSRAFTPRRVASLRPFVEEMVDRALDDLLEADGGDIQTQFGDRIPAIAIARLVGVGEGEHDRFVRWARAMVLGVFGEPTNEQAAEIAAVVEEMGPWFDEVLEDRTSHGDDVFALLTRASRDEDRLDAEELRVFVFTLLVAGSFTTAFLIGNGVLAILDNPRLLERMATDPGVVPAFVEEVLRHDSPVQVIQRTVGTDVELAGHIIAAGTHVSVNVAAANRDPLVFADSERFDIDRDGQPHLGFGHGAHFCLGAGLARLEAVVAFERLAARVRDLSSTGPIGRSTIPTFRGPTSLPVGLVAR